MASIGSESPPRKKLKQARLPFQVISSPRTDGELGSPGVKRKLSESDDIQITKIVKSTDVEEIKENTVQDDLQTDMKKMLSTLLTSKIINKCTENVDEDNKEENLSKTVGNSEEQINNADDPKPKSVLSKVALEKLESWKKPDSSAPPKTELVSAKDKDLANDISIASPEKKIAVSPPPNEIFSPNLTACSDKSVINAEILGKSDPGNSCGTLDHRLKEVDSSLQEDSNANLSKSAVVDSERAEDPNQTLNTTDGSVIMDVDVDLECTEGSKMDDDACGQVNSTASPKAAPCITTASPRTPKGMIGVSKSRLTPKQLARMKETARKQEEKERLKLEKERKKQEEHEEKLKAKHEKEEQKRKEKEEKEEQKRKEREEKEKKRQADIELKNEEKRRKEEQKAEEKRKKEDEKRKAEKEECRKMSKESAMFTSFFVAKTSKPVEKDPPACSQTVQNFMPFEVKSDMRVAPCTRGHLDSSRLQFLDEVLQSKKELPTANLYLAQIGCGSIKIGRSGRTWVREEMKDEEVTILEPDSEGVFVKQPKLEKMRAKFLQFHENHRPAYYGTWRKKSKRISGRRPTAVDNILDYDVDSADEWEEEEPGESLHGSDDEKEKESEDEYEVDNSVFVPHGYLSDDEGDAEIDEDTLNPEMQKAKLKILGEEFETQMKTKTSVLKPIVILLTAAMQSAQIPGSSRYQKLADRRAVWKEDEGPINVSKRIESNDTFGSSPLSQRNDNDSITHSGSRGPKKDVAEEAIPALITLLHGAPMKGSYLVSEFYEFLKRQNEVSEDVLATTTSNSENVWPKLAPASKASIARKLKELATYEQCNEEGPMRGKRCWVVPPEVRERFGVLNLKLPNRWKFILKRPRAEKTPVAGDSPTSSEGAQGYAEAIPSTAKKCLITNFTKVMTEEEKQLDWKRMKKSPPAKKTIPAKPAVGKITAFTSHCPPSNTSSSKDSSSPYPCSPTTSTATPAQAISPAPLVKKRVALLVSVPRGQDISCAVEAARSSSSSNAFSSANNAAPTGICPTETGSTGTTTTGTTPNALAPIGSPPPATSPTVSASAGMAPSGMAPSVEVPAGTAPIGTVPLGTVPLGTVPIKAEEPKSSTDGRKDPEVIELD